MFGLPLHPLVVHFPIVLVFLLPIFVAAALWAVRRGITPRRAWAVPVVAAAALWVSAFVATRTGEAQEDRVERVVSEDALHGHEEAAERFLVLSGVLFLVTLTGFARGSVGQAGRLVTIVGAIGLVGAGAQVGHSGGSLVYRHGAASAYTDAGPAAGPAIGGGAMARPADDRGRGDREDDH